MIKKMLALSVALLVLSTGGLYAKKYAGEIFRLGAGLRNLALGNCGLTDLQTNAPAYWNASLLTQMKENRVEMMHAEEFDHLLAYDCVSAVLGNSQKIGITINRIAIENIPLTKLANPDSLPSNTNRPYQYKSVTNADYLVYVGIGRTITDRFSYGITPKIVYRNLAEKNGYGFGADLSASYQLNNKIMLASRLHDALTTQMFWENGTIETVNPGLDVEGRYSLELPIIKKQAAFYLNTEIQTEGREESVTIALKPISMDFHTGLEVQLNPNMSILTGYNVDKFTAGLALQLSNWGLNYCYQHDSELDSSHRISMAYRWGK